MSRVIRLGLLLIAATAMGCVYPALNTGAVDTGGVAGGIPGVGGTVASGGAVSSGGITGTGGIVTMGGTSRSGGIGVAGGGSGVAGGMVASGGAVGSGGIVGTGGIVTMGGTFGSGGVTSAGGATSLGGVPSAGGLTSKGGVTRTGGPTPGGGTSGGGGGTSSGGLGGGGDAGAPGDAPVTTCISIADDLIADFTRDNSLNPAAGRQGAFYVYGDLSLAGQFAPPLVSGQVYPIDTTTGNPACSGPGSFHTKATGWGLWGAALRTDFVPKVLTEAGVGPDGTGFKGTYDASKYRGISFWARATAPLTGVQLSFPDAYTDGGATFAGLPDATDPNFTSCVYTTDYRYNCSPYLVKFGADPLYFPTYQNYQIDTAWKRFDVFFADTRQDMYNRGFHAAANPYTSNLDVTHLTGMVIQVDADYIGYPMPNDFEIWVDDVNFIR